ncbi:MAG: OmpA family protein [Bacteroidales bacterium]|nr:OmpA family protein [Bacteroidales bacterium]
MNKRTIFTGIIAALAFSSCVSLSEHETLQNKYDQTAKQYKLTVRELEEIKEENAALTRQNTSLTSDYSELSNQKGRCDATVDSLTRRIEQLRHHYDTTMENYMQEVAGKNRDLTRAQNLLSARTKELNSKEEELRQKEQQLTEQQETFRLQRSEMIAKQAELEREEAATRAQLQAKERELEAVRSSVTKALVGFADKGLKVETKDGKVYVSMENKLMFPSASWTVSKEGANAIKELAKVLEQDTTLNIMVEGHTDNDPYRGNTAVKDNWDLSVMRATAIVKLLLQHGPAINPSRIEACGHGEFAPKADNSTAEGKAANRRTEIILTPNLDKLLRQMGN